MAVTPRIFSARRGTEADLASVFYAPRPQLPRVSVILTDGVLFDGVEGSPNYRQVLQKRFF